MTKDFTHEIWQIWPVKSTQIIKASVSAKTLQFDECRVGDFTLEIWWISPWNLVDFNHEIWWISPRFDLWNPPKIIKASILAKTLQFDECRVGDFTLEIQWISPWNLVDLTCEIWWIFTQISPVKSTQNFKSKCFSKNSSVWWMQGGGYDQGFHEIHQISPWNLADLTCEIQWISPRYHLWSPPKIIKASVLAKNSSVWWMQGGGFHPGNLVDFTLKSGGFQPWNLVDFTQIWPVKSTQNYKSKYFSKNSPVWWMQGGGFHPWNPVDFTLKSGGFQPWNLVDFTQIWPVKSTQNYKSKYFSKNSPVWWMQGGGFHPWNPVDFTLKSGGFHLWNLVDFTGQIWVGISPMKSGGFYPEIWQISPRFHLWNPPKIIKASVLAKTLQFDECRVGGFHPEIWWIWPVKSGGFNPDLTCEIHPKL